MENFTFYSPTEFVFGKETEKEVGNLCFKYGATKVLIVYGGGSAVRSGLLKRVEDSLSKEKLSFVTLGGVKPNPTDSKVYEGIEIAKRESCDFVLAVGGGSVIDTAKAVAVGACYDGDFWDFYAGVLPIIKALKVAVVLTIPASGSEGSGNSVITNEKTLVKTGIKAPKILRPVFSILNPVLTFTLPKYQTACGITDMMAHVMERYFTNTPNVEVGDRLAEGILLSIITEAPKVMANPEDYDARANIMWSGMIAHNDTCSLGRAEDWSSHFMEHEISALYNVAHGAGLAVVFPAWLTWMANHHPAKVAQYAERVWNVKPSSDEKEMALEGIASLKEFLHKIGMPLTFSELGIENPDIDLMVKKLHALKGEKIGGYVKLTAKETKEIYQLAL